MKDLKKRNIIRTVFFFSTLLLSMATVASAQDNRTCSARSLAGEWGYTITGTLITPAGPVPFAAVGKLTADAEGNISGMQTTVVGGNVSKETLKATTTVNSDCTGTETVSVYDESGNLVRTATLAMVWDDNAREGRAIFTSLVLQPSGTHVPAIITINARKQFTGKEHNEE